MLDPNVEIFLMKMKKAGEERNVPNISWNTGAFLRKVIEQRKIATVFEIGSANGFSTIHLAEAIRNVDGRIVSVDLSRNAYEEGLENFFTYDQIRSGADASSIEPSEKTKHDNSGIVEKHFDFIDYYFCNALDLMEFFLSQTKNFRGTTPPSEFAYEGIRRFDLVFIDGRFKNTLKFYQLAKKILNEGGLIIIDDVVKYRWKMEDFYAYLDENKIAYTIEMTDEDDGVMLLEAAHQK